MEIMPFCRHEEITQAENQEKEAEADFHPFRDSATGRSPPPLK
jgi:hypothetical protein